MTFDPSKLKGSHFPALHFHYPDGKCRLCGGVGERYTYQWNAPPTIKCERCKGSGEEPKLPRKVTSGETQ